MKKKIFVVEGTHDEALLKHVIPNINTISVGGSQIKKDVVDFLVKNENSFDIVLLFDPDYAGENIRKKLSKLLTNPIHIFFEQSDAISRNKKKIGIEHVNGDKLKVVLNNEVKENAGKTNITISVLHELGLTGKPNSKALRDKVARHFHIGYCNTKTLLQRLSWLDIKKQDLERILHGTSS